MQGLMTGLLNGIAALVRPLGLLLFPMWIYIRWQITGQDWANKSFAEGKDLGQVGGSLWGQQFSI